MIGRDDLGVPSSSRLTDHQHIDSPCIIMRNERGWDCAIFIFCRYSTPPWSEIAFSNPWLTISLRNWKAWTKLDFPEAFAPTSKLKSFKWIDWLSKLLKFDISIFVIFIWQPFRNGLNLFYHTALSLSAKKFHSDISPTYWTLLLRVRANRLRTASQDFSAAFSL